MPTLTVNNCVLTYSFTDSNDHTKYILTITNVQKSGSGFLNHNSRVINLKVDNNSLVSSTAKQTPSVKDILKTVDHKGKVTDVQQRNAEADYKRMLSINENTAWNNFLNSFTSKKNAGKLRFEYTRDSVDKNATIYFTVFGTDEKITLIVPKDPNSEQPIPTTHEETKTIGIENVNDGKNYVINEEAYAKYGHIERVVDFSDVEDENQLLSLANIYVNALQFDDMSIEISAVDLHHLIGEVPSFDLLDEVRCISHPHGLNKVFPITEINIPLDDPAGVTYTMGKTNSSTMSQSTAANAAELFKKINRSPSPSTVLDAAKIEMSNILNQRTTGYVNIVQENDVSQALVISNSADWTSATKLWKFDINGLGYSDLNFSEYDSDITADGRYYKIGMTMDGTIVADFIKTGLLEDGVGRNRWNLSTGEFSLMAEAQDIKLYTTDSENPDVTTLADVVENTKQIEAINQKSNGHSNMLKGTGSLKVTQILNSSGTNGEFFVGDTGASVTIIDIEDSISRFTPNEMIRTAFRIHTFSGIGDRSVWRAQVSQATISVSPNTTYIFGCYVDGEGPITLQVGTYDDNHKYVYRRFTKYVNSTTWTRVNMVFSVSSEIEPDVTVLNTSLNNAKRDMESALSNYNNYRAAKGKNHTDTLAALELYKQKKSIYDTYKNQKEIYDATLYVGSTKTITVYFGTFHTLGSNIADNVSYTYEMCGFFLARGNAYEDWEPSDIDVEERSRIDTSSMLTQAEILKRLRTSADGSLWDGIFMKDGKLYIGAKYIDVGEQVSNILQSNYIQDSNNRNYWNLTDGTFKTRHMVADEATVYGSYHGGKLVRPNGRDNSNAYLDSIDIWGSTISFHGARYDQYGRAKYNTTTSAIRGSSANGYGGIELASIGGLGIITDGIYVARPNKYRGKYEVSIEDGETVRLNINGYYKKNNRMTYGKMLRFTFVHGLLTEVQNLTGSSSAISINRNPFKAPKTASQIKQYQNALMSTFGVNSAWNKLIR